MLTKVRFLQSIIIPSLYEYVPIIKKINHLPPQKLL